MKSAGEGWLPIESLPVGLITWYLSSGQAVTIVAAWLAVVNGDPPELRAGCPGMATGREALLEGADFAINIPADLAVSPLRELVAGSAASSPVVIDNLPGLSPARSVRAPLLNGCALQIECAHGRAVPGGWDAELAGDVRLLRRGGLILDPSGYPDFCALRPLQAIFPS